MSSFKIWKSPDGINASFPLSTMQIITFSFCLTSKSFKCMSFKKLFSSIFSEIIFALCQKKLSALKAFGKNSLLAIFLADSISGLTINEIPKSSLTNLKFEPYSGFLTLAIVYFAPIFLAITQAIIFSSSVGVVAIKISAESAPASRSVSYEAPFPMKPVTSFVSTILFNLSSSFSTTMTSFPTSDNSLQRDSPTTPAPTIIIFIVFSLSFI